MPTINGNTLDFGCYVDGHWGQYGTSRVLRIADDLLGTNFFDQAVTAGAEVGTMTDELQVDDVVVDIADEAEAALNDATDGGVWMWEDGEFFLADPADFEDEA